MHTTQQQQQQGPTTARQEQEGVPALPKLPHEAALYQ